MNPKMRSTLLALCAIDGVNWNVVAREAQRLGGLERLLSGAVGEKSDEARTTEKALRAAPGDLDAPRARADEEIARAHDAGASLVTVLDDEYPANLRVIYNPPPFLFHRGQLERDDARSVAVVGTQKPLMMGSGAHARWPTCSPRPV